MTTSKWIMVAIGVAAVAHGIGILWPRTPVGRLSNKIYDLLALLLQNASSGAVKLSKLIGRKNAPRK